MSSKETSVNEPKIEEAASEHEEPETKELISSEPIETDEQNVDLFSEFFDQKRVLMKEILKSKHCNSDVIKNLIATKHDSYTKYIS